MRKVSKAIIKAFMAGESKRVGNTSTDGLNIWLHGNLIASRDSSGLIVSDCGWQTVTTKERLNSLFLLLFRAGWVDIHYRITQSDFEWFINGEEWKCRKFIKWKRQEVA